MGASPTPLIFVLWCVCAYSAVDAQESLQTIFSDDWCPKIKLYNGEKVDLGCFDSVLGFLPFEPKKINPTYSLYKGDDPSRCVRQWKYDEPLDHEADDVLSSDSHVALVVHGFRDANEDEGWMQDMKDALLNQSEPEKRAVIIVDWSEGAEGPNYARAASNVVMLGRITAELLNRLTKRFNLNTDNFHLVGHSLGGQTVGMITQWWNSKYGVRVGRATGLDVAAPLFEERRIWPSMNDSKFLEGIHTSSGPSPVTGDYGLTVNFAHIDVYPNGGKAPQPGCLIGALDMGCSHGLAKSFFEELVRSCAQGCNFEGQACRSVACAEDADCEKQIVDLCERAEAYSRRGAEPRNQIVYIDTTSEAYKNRCGGSQNTTESE